LAEEKFRNKVRFGHDLAKYDHVFYSMFDIIVVKRA